MIAADVKEDKTPGVFTDKKGEKENKELDLLEDRKGEKEG